MQAFSSRALQGLTVVWLAGAVLLASCGSPVPERATGREDPFLVDLIRHSEMETLGTNQRGVIVWSLDGDSRRGLFLHPPQRFGFEDIPVGTDCSLRFGIGLSEEVWEKSDGVEFQVTLVRGEREERLFSELLTPVQGGRSRWHEREVPLPGADAEGFSLVLETRPGPANDRNHDHGAWSSPRVECKGSKQLPEARLPLILLVSIDTLRPDHLGVYGYSRDTSPELDRLAGESLVFENAFAPAPYTLPSHASMLTGLVPSMHRAGFDNPEAPLPGEVMTLAEMLGSEGYRTIGITAGGLMGEKFGFRQGFGEWHQHQRANLPSVLPILFDALDDEERKTFVFLHTYDVHGPYQQPADHRYFEGDWEEDSGQAEAWQRALAAPYHGYQELDRFGGTQEVVAAYDSGIRFVDSQLKRLFDHLREVGLYDSALIIITSDHGESLFERRRYFGHSHALTDQELRIPLIVKLPSSQRRGRVEDLVELMDVVPMVLGQAEVPPASNLAGQDPLSTEAKGRWAVLGGSSHLGSVFVRSSRFKVVSSSNEHWDDQRRRLFPGAWELFPVKTQVYDLVADPMELENLFDAERDFPDEVRRLVSIMRNLEVPGSRTDKPPQLSPEAVRELRALGYLQ